MFKEDFGPVPRNRFLKRKFPVIGYLYLVTSAGIF